MSERWRNVLAAVLITTSLGVIVAVLAASPPSEADRVAHLASILKCPVCDSESIASSPSDLAREAHALIAERVAEGWSDDQVIDFFVGTYGEDVLLDPPGGGRTLLLWVLPVVAAVVGVIVVVGRRRRDPTPPSEADHSLVEAALREREQS
jgi:cytochrome c-type biogenesis protein CcmH